VTAGYQRVYQTVWVSEDEMGEVRRTEKHARKGYRGTERPERTEQHAPA
jgi:hypothetical protein